MQQQSPEIQGAVGLSKPPKVIKDALKVRRQTLQDLWKKGLSGRQLLECHTEFIDSCLADCFANCPDSGKGLALVALGGYGRRELFPFSDIDLMILHHPDLPEELIGKAAEAIFYPLWDAGFEVGHSVRTPEACLIDSAKDFFLQSAILDARLLAGSETLFEQMLSSYRQRFIEGRRQEYLLEILRTREARHRRFGLHSFQLEPNIKECRGGFRDIHAMLWTAQVVFGIKDIKGIAEAGLLTPTERNQFEQAWEHLIRLRNRLHYVSGRKNDQLFFEHQEEMAKAMGYKNDNAMLSVERFMRELYGVLQNISVSSDLFFEHLDEKIGLPLPASRSKKLEQGIELRNGRIHLTDIDILTRKPGLLMRLFLQSARTGAPLHYRARKAVAAALDLLDDHLRNSRQLAKCFLEILQRQTSPAEILTPMLETGLLSRYIPEFSHIESLAQHDLYHISTVDRHLVQTVDELSLLRHEHTHIFSEIKSPEVLFLAGILHDIGKGNGHGHAERGAQMAAKIAKRLGFTGQETEDLVFLIDHHLFLSHAAMRRDLEDEDFIIDCAKTIGDNNRLDMLYLLSIADARATGPEAWTDWKAALFMELYLKTSHAINHSDLTNPDREQAAEWMKNQVTELVGKDSDIDIDTLPDDYLLNFSPPEIARHIELRRNLRKQKGLVYAENLRDSWSVLIISTDQTGLLAKICGTLALHNFDVLAAQIHTWEDGTTVDVLNVRPANARAVSNDEWQHVARDLNLALANRLGLAHRLAGKKKATRSVPNQDLHAASTKVIIDNKPSKLFTVIEVFAPDKPALLYQITRTMADFGLNIHRAIIATQHERLIDVFYVLDENGEKITDQLFEEEIRQALLHVAASE